MKKYTASKVRLLQRIISQKRKLRKKEGREILYWQKIALSPSTVTSYRVLEVRIYEDEKRKGLLFEFPTEERNLFRSRFGMSSVARCDKTIDL